MPLIQSISGIRGTIGGKVGSALTPIDIVKFTAAFGQWILMYPGSKGSNTIVIGRDARPSGKMITQLVSATLQNLGIAVVDLGLSTTPTVAIAVPQEQARGGIVITASHNPMAWNALKLLNEKGEAINAQEANKIFSLAEKGNFPFSAIKCLGNYTSKADYIERHIAQILELPLIDVAAIKKQRFRVAVDAVNSTGGIAIPKLLRTLGVDHITELYCTPTGLFPHDPEPLPSHLIELAGEIKKGVYDLGIAVDPDVDRLAIIDERGNACGEEYTLAVVADYVLSSIPGNTVSNLASSNILKDITEKYGGKYTASAVGEVNVVAAMKASNAVIGGEGNGGIIYPAFHYGRDALVGIALLLSHVARSSKTVSAIKAAYPKYFITKNKLYLSSEVDSRLIFYEIRKKYVNYPMNTEDGIKIILKKGWIHLRRSNTEPLIRIYAEADSAKKAANLVDNMMQEIHKITTKKLDKYESLLR